MIANRLVQELIYDLPPALGCSIIKKELIPPVEIILRSRCEKKEAGNG